jgi:hypothetical protein
MAAVPNFKMLKILKYFFGQDGKSKNRIIQKNHNEGATCLIILIIIV